ncbi:MAG: hypothetical protein HZB99_02495 [Candidatus Harrisonbacteria bacterium]|nr:hypothetical protein [Candidatus Harrisonbacteria bacterium]
MKLIKDNHIDSGHFHAWCRYDPTSWKHYAYLFASIMVCKIRRFKSVTTHLPLELQHHIYPRRKKGERLIKFGEFLAALIQVNLYWENAPLFNFGTWDLKHGQIEWELVPKNIPLCFDTGHAMLGAKSSEKARESILTIFKKRAGQIKHLHVHENDLIHDTHTTPNKIITKELLLEITKGKTYIFEK